MTDQASQVSEAPLAQVNVNRLGLRLDGWADLIENMGDNVEAVRDQVHQILVERNMPDVEVKNANGIVGYFSSAQRRYTITTTSPGATTSIYVGEHGKDLYVSWNTYIRPLVNWIVLGVMFILAILASCALSSPLSLPIMGGSLVGLSAALSELGQFEELAGLASLFSAIAFFVVLMCLCGGVISIFIFEAIIVGIAGLLFRRDFLGFFFIEPNVFDADDIVAMGLAVHKSVLKALERVGIDATMLRSKPEFQSKRGQTA